MLKDSVKPNAWISEPYYLKDGIIIHLLVKEYDKLIRMAVIIEEITTKSQIVAAWPKILELRQDLNQITGSDPSLNIALYRISQMYKNGMSILGITKSLNYSALASLCCAYKEKLVGTEYSMGWVVLHQYCSAFGIFEDDFLLILQTGHRDLEENRLPWDLLNGPFQANTTRERIRYFDKRVKKSRIVISELWDDNRGEEISEAYLFANGYYELANSLLKNHAKDQWKRNQKWINAKLEAIADRIKTGPDILYGDFRQM